MTQNPAATAVRPGPGFAEFVCLIAALMALNALAIDIMLPALPAIGEALGVENPNSRQWVMTAYLVGFGLAQVFYGPLADRYGRKPILVFGVCVYVIFALAAALAPTFETLLAARVAQGVGAASLRVLVVSIVRDRYEGRLMARVMSLSFLVFLGVPMIAPALGQLVLAAFPWQGIFAVLGLAGSAVLVWATLRLPETLHPEHRLPIQPRRIALAFHEALTHRLSIGYTLAMTAITAGLFGFINSAQQIVFDIFDREALFGVIFASIAGAIAVASLLNSALVVRMGARRLSHIALIGFTATAAVHAGVALAGHETLTTFVALQALTMFFFGFIPGNFGSMAMEPMGHIAGTASSAQGVVGTTLGAAGGFLIGQAFDGTTVPLTVGITLSGLAALVFVLIAERGRLFAPRNPTPA